MGPVADWNEWLAAAGGAGNAQHDAYLRGLKCGILQMRWDGGRVRRYPALAFEVAFWGTRGSTAVMLSSNELFGVVENQKALAQGIWIPR